jgi:hypothetical protein
VAWLLNGHAGPEADGPATCARQNLKRSAAYACAAWQIARACAEHEPGAVVGRRRWPGSEAVPRQCTQPEEEREEAGRLTGAAVRSSSVAQARHGRRRKSKRVGAAADWCGSQQRWCSMARVAPDQAPGSEEKRWRSDWTPVRIIARFPQLYGERPKVMGMKRWHLDAMSRSGAGA